MKMSVTVTFDNPETANIAAKVVQKVINAFIEHQNDYNVIQSDNDVFVGLSKIDKTDQLIARMDVMKFESIINILYDLAWYQKD